LSKSGVLLLGAFTRVLMGQALSTPPAAGRSGVVGSPSTSQSHTGQLAVSSTTGIRSWIGTMSAFGSVVMMQKLRVVSPEGQRYPVPVGREEVIRWPPGAAKASG
jgi:hypothetical protein